jgi:hypothetical protein
MQQGIFTLISSNINIDGCFAEEYYMPNNNVGRGAFPDASSGLL